MNNPGIGHNIAVTAPTDEAMLADLKSRYPEVGTELAAFEEALKTYPDKLTLEDEPTAAALQDLLGKMSKQKKHWASDRSEEKGPWNKVLKVVQNYFGTAEDKIDAWLEKWKPVHQQFLDLKAADARRKAEEVAEAQRQESERLRAEAEAAERRIADAAAAEAEARRQEELARQRAAAEELKRKAAEAAAAAAAAEEKRLSEERRAREKAEKDANAEGLKGAKVAMKEAEKLHVLAEAGEIEAAEDERLDEIVRRGGIVSRLMGAVAQSLLLDDEQKLLVETIKARLSEMRHDAERRLTKAEAAASAARAEAQRVEQDRLDKEASDRAAERERQRLADDEAAREAREAREAAEAEAGAAKVALANAKQEVRDARKDAQEAAGEQKGAAKDMKAATTDADRAENRADRLERKIENATDADFGRLRGELGTVGSQTGRYERHIIDEAALRASLGPLGGHFTTVALEGATYQWMAAHRGAWNDERITEPTLPGVIFTWERDGRIG